MSRIRLVTLDLDDTLWPIASCIARAETRLHEWLAENCPRTAARFDIDALPRLRREVEVLRPELAGDISALRRESIALALTRAGDDATRADEAFEVFWRARNEAECFDDVKPALARLRQRYTLAAVSNGNACVKLAGLGEYFHFAISAREAGVAKPAAGIFLDACRRAGVPPNETLHAGDDIECDVRGALNAGLKAAWINRGGQLRLLSAPALTFTSLTALADYLSR